MGKPIRMVCGLGWSRRWPAGRGIQVSYASVRRTVKRLGYAGYMQA